MSNREDSKNTRKHASSIVHFAAGLTTGILSAALLQPADLLKTRRQQGNHSSSGSHHSSRTSRTPSLRATLATIVNSPSPARQLWRGTLPSVLRTGFGSALYFSSLAGIRGVMARRSSLLPVSVSNSSFRGSSNSSSTLPTLSPTSNLLAGALARTFAGLILMPLTVLKVRYESTSYSYTSLGSAARGILRSEGLRGFWTGAGATALRDAPYAGLYVLFYESTKTKLAHSVSRRLSSVAGADGSGAAFVVETESTRDRPREETKLPSSLAAPVNFAAGVFAAATATALTNPFDVVKTRLQLDPKRYGNWVRAVRMLVGQEGWRVLGDGLALRMARKAASSAIAWTIYEELVRVGERRAGLEGRVV